MSHLLESSKDNKVLRIPWTGPGGYDYVDDHEADKRNHSRRMLLVDPKANVGKLLGYMQKAEDIAPGLNNPRPLNIIRMGVVGRVTNSYDENVTLWLTINDMYLDENAINAYTGNVEGEKRDIQLENWAAIKHTKHWDLWFEDNIGQYLVNMTYGNNEIGGDSKTIIRLNQ